MLCLNNNGLQHESIIYTISASIFPLIVQCEILQWCLPNTYVSLENNLTKWALMRWVMSDVKMEQCKNGLSLFLFWKLPTPVKTCSFTGWFHVMCRCFWSTCREEQIAENVCWRLFMNRKSHARSLQRWMESKFTVSNVCYCSVPIDHHICAFLSSVTFPFFFIEQWMSVKFMPWVSICSLDTVTLTTIDHWQKESWAVFFLTITSGKRCIFKPKCWNTFETRGTFWWMCICL